MFGLGKKIDPSESILNAEAKPAAKGEAEAPLVAVQQFEPRKPRFALRDVILPDATRRSFDVLLSRLRNHKLLYDDWKLGTIDPAGRRAVVNFYGPPGTGKTMCAEAVAAELGRPIIEVNYAEIESKYVGETPKNIRNAFRAGAAHDAVLFFDEADSILGRRMTNVTQAADQAVNVSRAVMLKQLDEFTGVVVFATNLARNFDGAFVRRILLHIEVPPPDRAGRLKLWQRMIPTAVPGRDTLDWDRLADASDGLVGGEIKNAVITALAEAADRRGIHQVVRMTDLELGIANVVNAKRHVGAFES